jgi:hypothetical protein
MPGAVSESTLVSFISNKWEDSQSSVSHNCLGMPLSEGSFLFNTTRGSTAFLNQSHAILQCPHPLTSHAFLVAKPSRFFSYLPQVPELVENSSASSGPGAAALSTSIVQAQTTRSARSILCAVICASQAAALAFLLGSSCSSVILAESQRNMFQTQRSAWHGLG